MKPSIDDLEKRIKKLEATIAVMRVLQTQTYYRKMTSQEFHAILENKDLWPICQNPKCRMPIPYKSKPGKRNGRAKWLKQKYCSRSCVTQVTNHKLAIENPPKLCVECGSKFARSNSEAVSVFEERYRCYQCSPEARR